MRTMLLAVTFGIFLAAGTAYAGPVPGGTDSDSDGVEDAFDNCVNVPNPAQTDTDHNGCGNDCSPRCNFNGNATVDTGDFLILKANFGSSQPDGTGGDCEPIGNTGNVGTEDFLLLKAEFGMANGPSGITNAQCDTASCLCTPAP
ncbi:MAG: hypothetical protein E4H11_03545 [Myxococcales bacterium]|nr:MAG: hypothetical protein E4H11_03545 [Myxococcales bacterium]